jgi:hypothetical protein
LAGQRIRCIRSTLIPSLCTAFYHLVGHRRVAILVTAHRRRQTIRHDDKIYIAPSGPCCMPACKEGFGPPIYLSSRRSGRVAVCAATAQDVTSARRSSTTHMTLAPSTHSECDHGPALRAPVPHAHQGMIRGISRGVGINISAYVGLLQIL